MNLYDSSITPRSIVEKVIQFNQVALQIQPREIGLLSPQELTYASKALLEERQEFIDAHAQQDVIGAVDAVLDNIYFSIGFLYRMGLTADQINEAFGAVHAANMEKKAGTQAKRGGDGVVDAVKPDGWTGPEERIARILGG